MQISSSIENNRTFFQKKLRPDISFDVVDRNLMIGGRYACLYCIDGFTKDDTLLKVLQAMSSIETAQMPDNANDFAALYLAYGEIGLETDSDALIIQLLSGVPFLLIDGYAQAPIPPAESANLKRIRYCAARAMVLSKRLCSIRL